MRTSSKFETGGHTYEVNMWHPDKAIENLAWLTKLCGESIVALLVNVDSVRDLMDSEVDLALLTPAVSTMLKSLDEKEVVVKVNQFVDGMLCDGAQFKYDTHFMGRPGHLLKVLVNVLKVQYADFFAEIPAGIVAGKNPATTGKTSTPAH